MMSTATKGNSMTEQIVVDRPTELAANTGFERFQAQLAEFKARYDGVVYDMTVPSQEKAARSDRLAIGRVISALDARHKEIKAPLKEQIDLIDGARKQIKDDLLGVQEKIKAQIKAHEDSVAAKEAELESLVEALRQTDFFDKAVRKQPSSDEIQISLDLVNDTVVDDSYGSRMQYARSIKGDTTIRLKAMLAKELKRAADAAELERLRKESEARQQAERDEAIRKEAFDHAKREVEKEAANSIAYAEAAKAKAEQDAKDAEASAAAHAEAAVVRERERIEAEQRVAGDQEAARVEAEEKAKAKASHRTKIQEEAIVGFTALSYRRNSAEVIVKLICDGHIPHVVINY